MESYAAIKKHVVDLHLLAWRDVCRTQLSKEDAYKAGYVITAQVEKIFLAQKTSLEGPVALGWGVGRTYRGTDFPVCCLDWGHRECNAQV